MVVSCCAFGCKERFIKGGKYTFHSFPKDEKQKKLWEIKVRRKNFIVTKHSRLCSKHFSIDCFDVEKFGATWLKPDAIPTLFDFSEHLQLKKRQKSPKKRRKSPKKRNLFLKPNLNEVQHHTSDVPTSHPSTSNALNEESGNDCLLLRCRASNV